ncbi:MAG TPA: universal stress protein [Hyphomicrobiaceae bacterium]|nr:universal stress protein [Hyphomicrobiaceae bacterium]
MYKHILIATDGSELADKAVTHGLSLAKAIGAKVTAVTVSEPWAAAAPGEVAIAFPVEDYEAAVSAEARQVLAAAGAAAQRHGVACDTIHVKDRFPAEGILETAGKKGCDLIVMASHGRRGLAKLLLGSQAVEVLTRSTVPVLICR